MSKSEASGMNPMQWDCERQGCFNELKRLKIEVFAECLPGRIAFSDVDAIVEVNGNLLVLEWKTGRYVPRGQALLYARWTGNSPAVVILVVGDAQHMTVDEIAYVADGAIGPWRTVGLADLKELISDWSAWALSHTATANRRQTA